MHCAAERRRVRLTHVACTRASRPRTRSVSEPRLSRGRGQLGDGGNVMATLPKVLQGVHVCVCLPHAVGRNAFGAKCNFTGSPLLLPTVNTCACRGAPPAPWTRKDTNTHMTHAHTQEEKGPLGGRRIKMISAGDCHSMALTHDGCVFAWGSGTCGQIGHGSYDVSFFDSRFCVPLAPPLPFFLHPHHAPAARFCCDGCPRSLTT